MFVQKKDVVGVFLSEKTFKIVQLKASGSSPKVVNVFAQDIKDVEESALPGMIQDAFRQMKIKSEYVVCVVPPEVTTTKNIEIPSTDPEEIKSIVSLQAGRHTPFSRDEIQVGYISLGTHKENYTKVLLIIVNQLTIKNQINILSQAGIKVEKVLFSPEGMAQYYEQNLNLDTSEPVGIINVGKYSTDFVIVQNGLPITSRNIPCGRDEFSANGEEAKSVWIKELSQTVESYQTDDVGPLPSKYILTLDDEINVSLQAALSEQLKWTVEVAPYVDALKTDSAVLESLVSNYANYSFLDIISSSVIADGTKVNLLPEDVRLQESVAAQGKEVFKAAVLAFVILVLVGGAFAVRLYFKNAILTKFKNQYHEQTEEVQKLKSLRAKTRIIQSYMAERMLSLDAFKELYQNVPDEIYLTNIVMNDAGEVNIQGVSDAGSLVYSFGSQLEETEIFKRADIKSTTAKKDRGKDATGFDISLKMTEDEPDETGTAVP